jgi:hypothetical protein
LLAAVVIECSLRILVRAWTPHDSRPATPRITQRVPAYPRGPRPATPRMKAYPRGPRSGDRRYGFGSGAEMKKARWLAGLFLTTDSSMTGSNN